MLAQDLLVDGHHHNVVEVKFHTRIGEHAYDVCEVIQLVLGKEFVVQVKRPENHVDDRHIVFIGRVQWVIPHGQIWPAGV